MKKLLTLLPLSIVLAACATNPSATTAAQQTTKAYDRMAPEHFVCEDNGSVLAKYSIDGEEAMLNVSLPKANWNNQTLTMQIAPSGSGARYVNNANQNVTYDWHTKADMGIMTLTWANGNEYSVNCQSR
ncbi:MliC family protein [Psychrobacter lutiphocae]|uniref:MliC family protein n=1 Tax=Psychrobacter lutiphocae TaxID=540500 RepID=UPI00036863B2|nr:MliC family protein [Psychrobacter lutiphocae]